jgi:uncharacterized protein YegL
MIENDFSAEAVTNFEQKWLCVLVLDVSSSMNGTPIAELNRGLQDFYKEIEADESTSCRLEVSLISFSHIVTTVQEPALIENFKMPILEANGETIDDGETAMIDAVNAAIDKVQARKNWYKSTGQYYYRPRIILITDGKPDSNQDVTDLANRIKTDTAAKRYFFLPIGVEGANMAVLNQIAGDIPAMSLKDAKFKQFISTNMGIVVDAGEKVTLADPGDWWKLLE